MILSSVIHYLDTNTLEVSWVEPIYDVDNNLVDNKRVKCQSYSSEQKEEFIADTGKPEYPALAGW